MDEPAMIMNQEDIKRIIPHRDPMLLLDRVMEMQGDRIVCEKHLTGEEDFFRGHFPEYPVMPGVLIVEAMAQAAAVHVLSRPEYAGRIGFFGGIDKVRFKRQVRPGDTIRMEVVIKRMRGTIGFAEGKTTVNGQLACSAEMILAIEPEKK